MTGVSQATVSLVLNGRADADVRIAPETRERVLAAIRSTGYVADPIARRLADRDLGGNGQLRQRGDQEDTEHRDDDQHLDEGGPAFG